MRPVKIIDRELKEFSGFFSKPQFSHFREYIIGLYTSYGRKTIANINENSGNGTDQSQLNRFLTNPKWNMKGLREKYEEYAIGNVLKNSSKYVFLIFDDTVKPVAVKNKIEGVAKYFDHAEKHYVWGHKFFTSAITNGNGLIEPFVIEMYRKRIDSKIHKIKYKKITNIAKETVEKFALINTGSKEKVALFDTFYACKKILKTCIDSSVHFVTKVKSNKKFIFNNKILNVKELSKFMPFVGEITIKDSIYEYSKPISVEWNGVGTVFLIRSRLKGHKEVQYFITDLALNGAEILELYSKRWDIESMHRDLKQNVGFGDYMVRKIEAIKTHVLLSSIAYAILSKIRFAIIHSYFGKVGGEIYKKIKKYFTISKLCKLLRKGLWAKVLINLTGVKFNMLKNAKL